MAASASTAPAPAISAAARKQLGLIFLFLAGAVIAVSLGLYARLHSPSGRPITTFGFSGLVQMKAWLTTGATALVIIQLVTALWMWGRLPKVKGYAPAWAQLLHRFSGSIAFILTLPVAFSCVWSLGFQTYSWRVVLHGVLGCLFYGAYAAKMLGLRLKGLPGWTLPVLGGTVFALLVGLWLTAGLWFFTRHGLRLA